MGHHASNVASNIEVHGLYAAVKFEVERLIRRGCAERFAFRLACLHVFGRAR